MDNKLQKLLNSDISALDLENRTIGALKFNGVNLVKELVSHREYDVKRFRNIGDRGVRDINECLTDNGLSLGMDLSEKEHSATENDIKTMIQSAVFDAMGVIGSVKKERSLDTPLWQLTVGELMELLNIKNETTETKDFTDPKHVYGLSGLCDLLKCSHPTAQRIKDSGKIPFIQIGRKLIFDSDAVLSALGKNI